MTQLSVMDLAKQGDPQAIASLINRSLASKGIHAAADLEGDCLKISLQAIQIPNPKAVVTIIQRGMLILQVEKIKRLKILTYRSDNNYLAWQQEIVLDSINASEYASSNSDFHDERSMNSASSDADIIASELSEPAPSQRMQSPNANLANNPKGVILVQSLSQIQQNLQEYQDVIVRFTDEQVGTVRCLTTLTELIQVISKPSFLFAAVASNPNLRSLLDAIAESSHTDEHGDQVIQNLSILQPGQQWQKAKVRLATKIFLEPAQDAEMQDRQANRHQDRHQGITLDLSQNLPEQPSKAVLVDADEATSSISPPATPPSVASPENTAENISQNLLEQLSKQLSEKLSGEALAELLSDPASPSSSISNPPVEIPAIPKITTPIPEIIIPPIATNSPNVDAPNEAIAEATNKVTVDSLFDDFADSAPVASSSQNGQPVAAALVSPVPQEPEVSEQFGFDLFDGFGSSNNSAAIAAPASGQLSDQVSDQGLDQTEEDLSLGDLFNDFDSSGVVETRQVNDDTLTFNTDDDLFNDFGSPSSATSGVLTNVSAPSPDLGATTIERLMSNIDSIPLTGASSMQPSQPMVTLADFSEDLDAIGF